MAGFLEKLRALSDRKKKVVIGCVVTVLALGMGSVWLFSAINRFSTTENFWQKLNLPDITAPFSEVEKALQDSGTATATDWKMYENIQGGFSLKYPEGWGVSAERDDGPLNTIFLNGKEGKLQISYGQGFGGMCQQGYEKIMLGGKEFESCRMVQGNGDEEWSIQGDITQSIGMGIFATANNPHENTRGAILGILSTFTFTK